MDIARQTGLGYQNLIQRYKRECLFRKQAFYYPFIEYITTRTEKAIRKSIGEEALAHPEKLNKPEVLCAIMCWPGVGNGVLNDLAAYSGEVGHSFRTIPATCSD